MTAGHNALRGSGPDQQLAFKNALAQVGCPDRRNGPQALFGIGRCSFKVSSAGAVILVAMSSVQGRLEPAISLRNRSPNLQEDRCGERICGRYDVCR
jgi:hypothetical protein